VYLSRQPAHADRKARFDVIGIDRDRHGKNRIEWLRDAFSL
jgi:Holliday junction resolvase-like predicted endonuclease